MISSIAARARRHYHRLSELASQTTTQQSEVSSSSVHTTVTNDSNPTLSKKINIVILDSAQTKFNVPCDLSWTVKELKTAGQAIYMVEPSSQRLIYRGRLLDDEQRLEEVGIVEEGTILHLFPKPKVVIASSSDEVSDTRRNDSSRARIDASSSSSVHTTAPETPINSAHIPRIVLDADETARNTEIIILSTHELFEAQHRVRLLSLMLLVYSFMELLNLFSKATYTPSNLSPNSLDDDRGLPPGDPTDTNIVDSLYMDDYISNTDDLMSWRRSDYLDLLICILGVYVAKLGLKATSETTLKLVRRYFIFLIFVGILWIIWYFVTTADNKKRMDENKGYSETSTEIYTAAAMACILPVLLWLTCFMRAWQFQELVRDAEQEAETSMNQLMHVHNYDRMQGNNTSQNLEEPLNSVLGRRDNDLELQMEERRTII